MTLGTTILISHPESPSISEQLALYRNVGFDSVFIGADTVHNFENIPKLADEARRLGIVIEAFHAPSGYLDDLWMLNDDKANMSLHILFDAIDACSLAKVEKLVMHTACARQPQSTESAINRFAYLEEYARKKDVIICYENSNILSSLATVMDNVTKPHGFCFDAGHQLCYCPGTPLLSQYGSCMLYTHLHDNDGKNDLHYLPFDGNRDWDALAKTFADIGYNGTLNLELACHSSERYRNMPFDVFVNEAYIRLRRFCAMVDSYR